MSTMEDSALNGFSFQSWADLIQDSTKRPSPTSHNCSTASSSEAALTPRSVMYRAWESSSSTTNTNSRSDSPILAVEIPRLILYTSQSSSSTGEATSEKARISGLRGLGFRMQSKLFLDLSLFSGNWYAFVSLMLQHKRCLSPNMFTVQSIFDHYMQFVLNAWSPLSPL
eukprot:Gb_24996 [translate_table: standard]